MRPRQRCPGVTSPSSLPVHAAGDVDEIEMVDDKMEMQRWRTTRWRCRDGDGGRQDGDTGTGRMAYGVWRMAYGVWLPGSCRRCPGVTSPKRLPVHAANPTRIPRDPPKPRAKQPPTLSQTPPKPRAQRSRKHMPQNEGRGFPMCFACREMPNAPCWT